MPKVRYFFAVAKIPWFAWFVHRLIGYSFFLFHHYREEISPLETRTLAPSGDCARGRQYKKDIETSILAIDLLPAVLLYCFFSSDDCPWLANRGGTNPLFSLCGYDCVDADARIFQRNSILQWQDSKSHWEKSGNAFLLQIEEAQIEDSSSRRNKRKWLGRWN